MILLIASYIFYAWFDIRFAILLFGVSIFNYFIGNKISSINIKAKRKHLYIFGLMINIIVLIIFKYLGFFASSLIDIMKIWGFNVSFIDVKILLPIGISFYIFLSISYITDVFRGNLAAEMNIINLLLSNSFFPILLAGPLNRPISLIPQIRSKRFFDYKMIIDGLKQILWGFFMKIVIANPIGSYVDIVFSGYRQYSGFTLLISIILFAIQIYADFAGYSNIAIGLGKMLGFSIISNFNYPYFSDNIKEFWRRWNISLTTWLRDYIFLPIAYKYSRILKNSKFSKYQKEILVYSVSTIITWFLSGLWHGAKYTFIIWGILHGIYLIIQQIYDHNKKKIIHKYITNSNNIVVNILSFIITSIALLVAWVFFKSNTVEQAIDYIIRIFYNYNDGNTLELSLLNIIYILIFFIIEWVGRKDEYPIKSYFLKNYELLRWPFYYLIIYSILSFSFSEQNFIYFQF